MIPCGRCQSPNPLGSLFCRTCGARLEVKVQDVFNAVTQIQAGHRDDKILVIGRNVLSLGLFALVVALTYRFVVVPAPAEAQVPMVQPRSLAELLTPDKPDWKADGDVGLPVGPLPSMDPGKPSSLMDWRRRGFSAMMAGSGLGLDLQGLRDRQVRILSTQTKDGTFGNQGWTGLALLALASIPGDPAVDKAVDTGLRRLVSAMPPDKPAFLDSPPLVRLLVGLALLDGGLVPDHAMLAVRSTLAEGGVPELHAISLALLPSDMRPELISLPQALQNSGLWRHWLDLFSRSDRLVTTTNAALFTELAAANLEWSERLAWTHTAWYRAADARALRKMLGQWSSSGGWPVVPAWAAGLVPEAQQPALQDALALLVLSAPLRTSLAWVLNPPAKKP